MKILPCTSSGCRQKAYCNNQPYYVSQFPTTFKGGPYNYKCSRCSTHNSISPDEFNLLPEICPEDLHQHGVENWETLQLVDNLSSSQVSDCFSAGFTVADIRKGFKS